MRPQINITQRHNGRCALTMVPQDLVALVCVIRLWRGTSHGHTVPPEQRAQMADRMLEAVQKLRLRDPELFKFIQD